MIKESISVGNLNLKEVYSADGYFDLLHDLADRGETTGSENIEQRIKFTKVNYQRSKRIHKTLQIPVEAKKAIEGLSFPMRWIVVSEPWCGDSASIMPVISALAKLNNKIELYVVLRDANLEYIDANLTNGSRAIPKLIIYDELDKEIDTWGPRPSKLQEVVIREKRDPSIDSDQLQIDIQKWYLQDKGQVIIKEILELFT